MRARLRGILGIGVLVLATGCYQGVGGAAGLPTPSRPYPLPHLPDAQIVAREGRTRWEKQIDVTLARAAPTIAWPLFALSLAF